MEFVNALTVSSTPGFLLLGFLLGVLHAFEADHLAALGTLASGSPRQLILRGAAWWLGHTTTLVLLSSAVVLFSFVFTDAAAAALEFAVGIMLVLLGADVLRRARKSGLHVHVHNHGDMGPHIHLHSHAGRTGPHSHDAHDHAHPGGFPFKAMAIGLVHGAAGSAAIIALAAASAGSAWVALAYVALVGIGSIVGMAAISAAISVPILMAPKNLRWLHAGARLAVAAIAIGFGIFIMAENGALAMELF